MDQIQTFELSQRRDRHKPRRARAYATLSPLATYATLAAAEARPVAGPGAWLLRLPIVQHLIDS